MNIIAIVNEIQNHCCSIAPHKPHIIHKSFPNKIKSKHKTINRTKTLSEMNTLELNGFRQSSKIPRSPVRNRDIGRFEQSTRTLRSPVNRRDSEESDVSGQFGDQIRSLIEMLRGWEKEVDPSTGEEYDWLYKNPIRSVRNRAAGATNQDDLQKQFCYTNIAFAEE